MTMRRVFLWGLFVSLMAFAASGAKADVNLSVLSFNIRYGTANDGDDVWPKRKDLVFDVLRDEAPDFCGLQEALRFQIDEIRRAVPQYAEYGVGRDDGKSKGEYSAILYLEKRWKLDRGETLWFSDTPKEPGSASWGNEIPRIVTWGRFIEKKSGRAVFVFNTHFDHRSQPSRVRSAEFLSKLIGKRVDAPVIVTGDFNAGEENEAIRILRKGESGVSLIDTFRALHPDEKVVGTFNGFRGLNDGAKIDYVFADTETRVVSAAIVRTNSDSRFPSDHYPVGAKLVIPAR